MALPAYPSSLTHECIMDGFRILEAHRPPKWTEFEDGPPLARRSGAGRRAKLAYSFVFEQFADYDTFRAFVENDLVDGSSRFTMPVWVPVTGTYVTKTVMIDKGEVNAESFGLGLKVSFTLIVFDW